MHLQCISEESVDHSRPVCQPFVKGEECLVSIGKHFLRYFGMSEPISEPALVCPSCGADTKQHRAGKNAICFQVQHGSPDLSRGFLSRGFKRGLRFRLVDTNVIYQHLLRKCRCRIRTAGKITADCDIQYYEEWVVVRPGLARHIRRGAGLKWDAVYGKLNEVALPKQAECMIIVLESLSGRQIIRTGQSAAA